MHLIKTSNGPYLCLAAMVVSLLGCDAPTDPNLAPNAHQSEVAGKANQRIAYGEDKAMLELAGRIPGFGGVYREDDRIVLAVKASAANAPTAASGTDLPSSAAGPALRDELISRGEAAGFYGAAVAEAETRRALQLRVVRFSFPELFDIREAIKADPGAMKFINSLDVDESTNVVRLGVPNEADAKSLTEELAGSGLPTGSWEVQAIGEIVSHTTVQGKVRPTMGGTQIYSYSECSLGLNLSVGGEYKFVTADHCSDNINSVDGTDFRQHFIGVDGENLIGSEEEGATFLTPCGYAGDCVLADVMVGGYEEGVTVTGEIAFPNAYYDVNAPIDGRRFKVKGWDTSLVAGEPVTKVGRTTGMTFGNVWQTCVDFEIPSEGLWYLCHGSVIRPCSWPFPCPTSPISDGGGLGGTRLSREPAVFRHPLVLYQGCAH